MAQLNFMFKAEEARSGPALKAVDLFCGSGGLSAGLIDAGIEIVAAYDNWCAAVETYRRNIADHAQVFDLTNVNCAAKSIGRYNPDLIVGGPPCQDFSTAGKRTEGRQANLTIAFAEIVAQCAPKYLLMENVPQARLSMAYKSMCKTLQSSGYHFRECLLNASRCGVPQSRRRFFVFGWRAGDETTGAKFIEWIHDSQSPHALTVKDYLGSDIDVDFYYRHPRNYSRRSVFTVYEPSPTIRGVNRPVPPNYQGNHLDSAPPCTVRPLSSEERSRIQTFPKGWDWGAGDRNADVELQIGNAVPVNLGTFVGKGIEYAVA